MKLPDKLCIDAVLEIAGRINRGKLTRVLKRALTGTCPTAWKEVVELLKQAKMHASAEVVATLAEQLETLNVDPDFPVDPSRN